MTFVTMAVVLITLDLLTLSEGLHKLPLDAYRTAVFVDKGNWSSRKDICKKNYTDLVTIYDKRENEILSEFCKNCSYLSTCFIGLKKGNDTFKWSNGDPYNYTKTTSNDTNMCVAMNADGDWESVNCSLTKPFICYSDEPVSSSRYRLIKEPKNWYDAVSYCRENYTDLVSIRNEEQNSEVLNVMNHSDSCWIGLMRDSWEWSDNGQSTYRNHLGLGNNTLVGLSVIERKWKLFPEHTDLHAICYKDHIHISNDSMTWEESLDYCRNFNGSFCILTKQEQVAAERLMKRLKITEPVWVGLEQNSLSWFWTTGESVDWSNWEGGQRPRLCGALRSAKDDFKWKDMNCRTKLRALCLDWSV